MNADQFPNYVAGTGAFGSDATTNINPSDLNDTIGHYVQASAIQTSDAVEYAAAAFPKWRATSPLVRFEALDRIGSEILARVDELGDMLAREEGKTLPEAKAETHRAGHLFKYLRPRRIAPPAMFTNLCVKVCRLKCCGRPLVL